MKALLLTQRVDSNTQKPKTELVYQVSDDAINQQIGDVLIQVDYSSMNYKDALALTNAAPVVRSFPMVLGIDGVGTVLESASDRFQIGDRVLLNGFGCGETHWGCFAEKARLKSDWLIKVPESLTNWQTMAIGTAGYTAALCVLRLLQEGLKPADHSVLVNGTSGGVGLFALLFLKKLGFQVTAMTSKSHFTETLMQLGADQVINSAEYQTLGKPLQKPVWHGAIDVVGSSVLANICAQMHYDGVVACCGLAKGMDFPATVAPFILRNVTLAGIDSVMTSLEKREQTWQWIAELVDDTLIAQLQQFNLIQTIDLKDCLAYAQHQLKGEIIGRAVVQIKA